MINPRYRAQLELLFQTIPYIAKEKIFALKGGTAINLFIRSLPRLSVDIDLTYVPINDRKTALSEISKGLGRIKVDLEKSIPGISVTAVSREGEDVKINCQLKKAQIKIEVNTITRGTINDTVLMKIDKPVQETFGRFAAINVVSMAELYGGKICAALDRQHPRDLFDVKLLLENEGLTEEIMKGFLVSLISHMRPVSELLNPTFIDQRNAFETQFSGMSDIPFSYKEFEKTREELVYEIKSKLTIEDRVFLVSFKEADPIWEYFSIRNANELPAVRWKLQNLRKLKQENPGKHLELVNTLYGILFG
ncbi:MAG: nucleotidyl transferase AbiEii/AbiGii toxin family protein [Bacteroidales bacterium]|nr:nucleotidyl transferase AbiEii/AbiGii toxin family protein [Bacteroidales bacterium]MCB9013697.1 nucleotidyl transferase AbiEii/AbiGii toxin family protein [Bacteroidales bacterium]